MPSTTYTLNRAGDDFELDVEYTVAAYDPGNSYGPPEDCDPPSGGEIETLTVEHNGKPFALTGAETDALHRHIYETHDYSDDDFDAEADWIANMEQD